MQSQQLPNGGGAIPKVPKEHPKGVEVVTKKELQAASKLPAANRMSRGVSDNAIAHNSAAAKGDDMNAKDFLSRFDSSLAKIKSNVQKLEETSQ